MATSFKQLVMELDDATATGYSWDRYSRPGWRESIRFLLRSGCNAEQVKEVMLSKWTRWAADFCECGQPYGKHTSKDVKSFFKNSVILSFSNS